MMHLKRGRWAAVAPLAAVLAGSVIAGCGDKNEENAPAVSTTTPAGGSTTPKMDNQAVGDPVTTGKIKSALLADTTIGATGINVSTAEGGTVTLDGNVKTEAEKSAAEAVAQKTEGVTKVVNNLVVGGTSTGVANPQAPNNMTGPANNAANRTGMMGAGAGDHQAVGDPVTTGKIKSALLADTTIGATGINVSTAEGGQVSLTGNVKTQAAKTRAGQIAMKTQGAKKVINNLKVMP